MQNVLLTIITITLGIIGYFLKDAPNLFREIRVEKLRGTNETNIQIESYFRQISGKDIQDVFQKWITLIDEMNGNERADKELKKYLLDLQTKTLMYGSGKTTKIFTSMMQLTYENNKPENKIELNFGKKKDPDYRLLIYVSYLVASLKKDFTGYDIEPIDFLEARITDLNHPDKRAAFDAAEKRVRKELKEKGLKV